ncbi:ricin-type beta-trefoil lectin domain protein [Streptomyces sp. NPDC057579]|uniref:ricin-type beta-trefoil lectin domain protein n=1 Tax=Streptomyces sp. NPDC057579 TaxID=3346172 RepID=UPI0036B00858
MRRRRWITGLCTAVVLAWSGGAGTTALAGTTAGRAPADSGAANTDTPIGQKPMMGFNNWARFTCAAQARLDGTRAGYSFQDFMEDQAKAMKATGLVAAGYKNLTVDDCWMQRTSAGYLHGAAHWGGSSQPGFDWELTGYADRLHALGMEAGLYSTSGEKTCQGVPGGVKGHEDNDARSLAYWGIDSLKLDNCGTTWSDRQQIFTTTAKALNTATTGNDRKILFNESAPAAASGAESVKYKTMDWVRGLGQMWRVSPDITVWPKAAWNDPSAESAYQGGVYQNFTDTVALARYNGVGNHNDADMLLIGDNKQLTPPEQRSQFALWSAMGSPLMISTDVRKMAAHPEDYQEQLAILKNKDIIAVDQDPLGAGGYLASRDNASATAGIDVVVKPLADGSRAVTVLNKNTSSVQYKLDLARIGFGNLSCTRTARNLWTHQDSRVTDSISTTIGGHDNAMFTVAPGSCGGAADAVGQIQAAQSNFQKTPFCLDAHHGATKGAEVALWDCTGGANQQWRLRGNGLISSLQDDGLCMTGDPTGLRLAACVDSDPHQRWTYHRSGELRQATGACVDINGGALDDRSAKVTTYQCGTYQPNQTWSAPFTAPPAA